MTSTNDLDITLISPREVETRGALELLSPPAGGTSAFGLARVSSPAHIQDTESDRSKDYDEIPGRGVPNGILMRWKRCQFPSDSWLRGHTIYIAIFGVLIPTLVCFGVNFGVAVAIFRGNPPPTMWQFPIPIAGNYAAVIIVQTIVNFPLVGAASTLDTLNGLAPSLSPRALFMEMDPDTMLGWFLQPSELIYPPIMERSKSYCRRMLDTWKRTWLWILIQFIVIWPLFTGITWKIWGDKSYNDYPQPEFLSATLGGVLALCTCPIWAVITMLNMGARIEEENSSQKMRFDSMGGLGRGSVYPPSSPSIMV